MKPAKLLNILSGKIEMSYTALQYLFRTAGKCGRTQLADSPDGNADCQCFPGGGYG